METRDFFWLCHPNRPETNIETSSCPRQAQTLTAGGLSICLQNVLPAHLRRLPEAPRLAEACCQSSAMFSAVLSHLYTFLSARKHCELRDLEAETHYHSQALGRQDCSLKVLGVRLSEQVHTFLYACAKYATSKKSTKVVESQLSTSGGCAVGA